jgi:hypothetical protein
MIDRIRAELRAGRKASHWLWFVFPESVLLCREMDLFGRYWRVGKKFPPASRPMFSHQLAEFAYNGTLNWAGPSTVMSVRSRTALIVTL